MERGIHQFTSLALSSQLVVLLPITLANNLLLFARLEAVTKLKIQRGPELYVPKENEIHGDCTYFISQDV